jgi:excisionase family DNA binding protein
MNEETLLTTKEASDRLRLSISRLRTLIQERKISTYQHRRGSRILIPENSLLSYLSQK